MANQKSGANTMRAIIILASIIPSVSYAANCTSNYIGNTKFTRCSDGSSETSNRIGNSNFINGRSGSGESYRGTETTIVGSTWSNIDRNPKPSYQAPSYNNPYSNPYSNPYGQPKPYNPYGQ
jgi:hypothetical protein